jgi:hypothetical protein
MPEIVFLCAAAVPPMVAPLAVDSTRISVPSGLVAPARLRPTWRWIRFASGEATSIPSLLNPSTI